MAPPSLTSAQRARIRRRLLAWGQSHYQDFPWRRETDPWLTLVAEVLLQRTRAAQVVAVFETFKRWFPTAADLAAADPDHVAALLHTLGLHSRADVISQLAALTVQTGGVPPRDPNILMSIRGVGAYTAAAWLSLHRAQRAAIVDSNVYRWLGRMTGEKHGRDPRGVRWVYQLADALTPKRGFKRFNYAVLDFTMKVCLPRAPQCTDCPFARDCAYAQRHSNTQHDARISQ